MSGSSDFARLVSGDNPATRHYQQPGSRPPHQQADLLDPFFDDEEEGSDSAFGARPTGPSLYTQDSQVNLTQHGAPMAGVGLSKSSLAMDGTPQGWTFDSDDTFQATQPMPYSASAGSARIPSTPKRKKGFQWPWSKKIELSGERLIVLNNPTANSQYCSNFISTSKFNIGSFLPKFLYGVLILGRASRGRL